MHEDLHINKPFSEELRLNASAKSINPGQPAQSVQADLGQNFSLLANFLANQRTALPHDSFCC